MIEVQKKFEKSKIANKKYLASKIKLVQNKTNIVIYIDESKLQIKALKEKFQLLKRVEIEVYFLQKLNTTNNYSWSLKKYVIVTNTKYIAILYIQFWFVNNKKDKILIFKFLSTIN